MRRFTLIASFITALVCASTALAQIQAIGVGGGLAFPSGSFGNVSGSGFGANVRGFYKYEGLDNILLTGTIGYFRFGEKDVTFLGQSAGFGYQWSLIPIMSGGRYYFGDPEAKTRFFAGAEVGVHIYSVSLSDDENNFGSAAAAGSSEFALQPMVGVALGPLQVYGEYSLADLNYMGLKAMFVFPVGKK